MTKRMSTRRRGLTIDQMIAVTRRNVELGLQGRDDLEALQKRARLHKAIARTD
jgi:hypothetical protein